MRNDLSSNDENLYSRSQREKQVVSEHVACISVIVE